MSGSYRDIKVWQRAIELVVDIYSCTRGFPKEEMYGLVGQLRRCGVSSEQYRRRQGPPHGQGIPAISAHARGSVEVETQLTIAGRLGYISETDVRRLGSSAGEIARMLRGLIKAISSRESKQVA